MIPEPFSYIVLRIEIFQVFVVYRHGVFQRVFQPLERVHFMFFASGGEGIDYRSTLRSFMASDKELILASECNPTKRIFA